jgi:hypothetical protein
MGLFRSNAPRHPLRDLCRRHPRCRRPALWGLGGIDLYRRRSFCAACLAPVRRVRPRGRAPQGSPRTARPLPQIVRVYRKTVSPPHPRARVATTCLAQPVRRALLRRRATRIKRTRLAPSMRTRSRRIFRSSWATTSSRATRAFLIYSREHAVPWVFLPKSPLPVLGKPYPGPSRSPAPPPRAMSR